MNYALSVGQLDFIKSTATQTAIVSGLGGGKTFVLMLKCLLAVLRYPDAKHCFASLSYRNMKDVGIPKFNSFLTENNVPFVYHSSDNEFIVNGKTSVIFRSQDTADKMRSVEIGSLFCDELAYWKKENYLTFLGRLRDKNGPLIMRAATTPNGLNFFYKMFAQDAGKRVMIRTRSQDNKHLPEDYLSMLAENYDSDMLRQERDAEFIHVGGSKTYYMFNDNCVINNEELTGPVSSGMDFNVNPMTAIFARVSEDCVEVFDEMWLENSNTHSIGNAIKNRFGAIFILPDASGNSRKTSSSQTDHAILKELGHDIPRMRNPHRKDRFNCVNNLLEKGKLKIHSRCVHTIRDLSLFCDEENKDKTLGHISDALGYLCWHYFPINIRGEQRDSFIL